MIKFEPISNTPEDIILPKRGTKASAGYDFYAPCDIFIPANGVSALVFLGIKAKMPEDYFLQLKIRSSLAVKQGIVLETSGVIDADYYGNPNNGGNIGVKFRNNSNVDRIIYKGERCCQGIFMRYFITNDDDADAERMGGYGSTGKN